ncbi:hypothetical protein SK128_005127 [Halocaridina rubra]|uniref:Uncharacterized protein n=1 Tax=Halocaridina rubra TaxID=373956 RepID=A0AAN9A026_HALRR
MPKATLGLDIETKMINVPDTNYSVELYLYDCSGKDFYRGLVVKLVGNDASYP